MFRSANRLADVRPSATKAMTVRAQALRSQGREIITLSQGEPDLDTPENIAAAGIAAIEDGKTRYTAVAGIPELRAAIATKLERDNGLDYAADQTMASCGAKQVIFNAFLATLDEGDEVIVPAPCWVSYPDMVRLAAGTPVIVDCAAGAGFKLQPDQLAAAMILIHSKQTTPDEIEAFIAAWSGAVPLVLVPTAYPEMTVERMRATGKVGMAIWGNHTVRAAVTAIQEVYRRILAEGGIQEVDKDIVPVGEIFRLQDMDQVKDIERRFLR